LIGKLLMKENMERRGKRMIYDEKTKKYTNDNGEQYYDLRMAAKLLRRSTVTVRRYVRENMLSKVLDDSDRHIPDYCRKILIPCHEIDNW